MSSTGAIVGFVSVLGFVVSATELVPVSFLSFEFFINAKAPAPNSAAPPAIAATLSALSLSKLKLNPLGAPGVATDAVPVSDCVAAIISGVIDFS